MNADRAASANYLVASQVFQSFSVFQGTQSVQFTSGVPVAKVSGSTYVPTASASSNLTASISLSGASTGVCTLTGGIVSFVGVGNCILFAGNVLIFFVYFSFTFRFHQINLGVQIF